MEHEIIYPCEMDDYAWFETESKGWIEVTIRWASGERAIVFYDPIRLAQSVQAGLERDTYFAERIIVVPNVTEAVLVSTVAALAHHDFIGLP